MLLAAGLGFHCILLQHTNSKQLRDIFPPPPPAQNTEGTLAVPFHHKKRYPQRHTLAAKARRYRFPFTTKKGTPEAKGTARAPGMSPEPCESQLLEPRLCGAGLVLVAGAGAALLLGEGK